MKKKLTGYFCILVILISGLAFTQFVDQPPVEVPTIPEEELEIPVDQLVKVAKSLDLGTVIVSIERDKGLFGGEKDSFTFKFENGAEVKLNSMTGEVLKSKEGKKQDEEIMKLLSMTGISLEDALKAVMEIFQENKLESAELRADEIGNPMYVIVFEDLTVEVDATTGEIINPPVDMPSLPETEEVPQEEIPEETPEETPVNENEPFFPENLGDF
ncbi:MAG: PepSY domain-containing protein [Defluviitoga tunisiensis]|jgi:Peptidase propeptide and YPEB domain.